MMEVNDRISRVTIKASFLIEIFTIWILVINAITPMDHHGDSYNISCTEGCICGKSSSNHIRLELKTIDCTFAGIRALPDKIPTDLQVLSLKGNLFLNIPGGISKLKNLQDLDLSGNRIKSIGRAGIFRNMSNLIYLNIGKNAIATIFHNNLMGPKLLTHLILSKNKINYIEDEALADLKNLLSLDLEQNLLGTLYEEWFHGLSRLVSLNLSNNKIHSIPAAAFRQLGSLEHLCLSENRISSVEPRAFSGLLSLKILNLEGNLLSRTPTAAFQSLPSLETLILNENPLHKIRPLDFSHLTANSISLCQMPELSIIDAKAFYNLVNISSIHIHDNEKLAYIDPLAFMNVDTLTELQLHNNILEGLQKEMQEYVPDGMQITFHGNRLRCDCNARWLHQLAIQGDAANIFIIAPEHLSCQSPADLKGKSLRDLDVARLPKLCPPVMLDLTQSAVIVGKVGDRQALECRALGSPIPHLYWKLPDGSLINSTLNEVRRRFFPPGTLVYYHLKPGDAGLYTCIAQNAVGNASISIRLNVSGIDMHLFSAQASPTFISLVWNGTESSVFPSYKIIYKRISENHPEISYRSFNIDNPMRKRFTINHLHPQTHYQFCIGSEDSTGYWLQISCCQVTTPPLEDNRGGLAGISGVTVIAFAVTVTLMMVFFTCLASALFRNYRHRFYETPNKSESSASIPLDNLYRPLLAGS